MEVAATCIEPARLSGLSIIDIDDQEFNCRE